MVIHNYWRGRDSLPDVCSIPVILYLWSLETKCVSALIRHNSNGREGKKKENHDSAHIKDCIHGMRLTFPFNSAHFRQRQALLRWCKAFLMRTWDPLSWLEFPTFFVMDQTKMSRRPPLDQFLLFSRGLKLKDSELLNFGLISWDLRCEVISRMPYGHQIPMILTWK